jgi:hypothetical protein
MANGESAYVLGLHYTYRKAPPTDKDLEQGDLLHKTSELQRIIGEVHPKYLRDDYTHFLVLTQSCDLVRRGQKKTCKSPYITIAAVRALDTVVRREIEQYQDEFQKAGKVCSNNNRHQLKVFLERLFNYNEPDYFYLHSETVVDFEPHCTFLRLSVPLKISHYGICQDARFLSLQPLYQAKLGWMIGNIYSRIGTDEWVPSKETPTEFQQRIKALLDKYYVWEDEKRLVKARMTADQQMLSSDFEVIRQHIAKSEVPDIIDEVGTAVVKQLKQVQELKPIVTDELAVKIKNRLANDAVISKLQQLSSTAAQDV